MALYNVDMLSVLRTKLSVERSHMNPKALIWVESSLVAFWYDIPSCKNCLQRTEEFDVPFLGCITALSRI